MIVFQNIPKNDDRNRATDNAVKIKLEKLRRELDVIQSRVMEEREK